MATFTVKAAREMKERIGRLVGDGVGSKLILGTFHSIARRYLARYGHLIGVKKDFGIADGNDSLAIIKRITQRYKLTIEPTIVRTRISSRKSTGERYSIGPQNKTTDAQDFEMCYTEYQDALERANLLDYDDLLVRCADLLRMHPSCVSNVEAVLIDEFQDTNVIQFDLMRLFAAYQKRVTIVGDPDQSIYGFRHAETKNFRRMKEQYPETVTIPLEENYRSSGSILLSSLEVIQQDTSRINKTLLATHTVGSQPVFRKLASAHKEADWIVAEINRSLLLTGDLMDYSDVAILLRSSRLSRVIESSLGKAGIPYKMVGGLRFYDRIEVKLVLDYLRVISQPENSDALSRVINVPSRYIGEKTIKSLLIEADLRRTSLWRLVLDTVRGEFKPTTELGKRTQQGLSEFVNLVLTGRKRMADHLVSAVSMVNWIVTKLSIQDYLTEKYPNDFDVRMANIEELVAMADEFTTDSKSDDDALPEIDGLGQGDLSQPLSKFLVNVALSSAGDKEEEESIPQVTISTIHAAKGLEWPIVFIPGVYEGSIPHSRATPEEFPEERRLLYVAMTRAKVLLYLSYPLKNSDSEPPKISPFMESTALKPFFATHGPTFESTLTQAIAQILRRQFPTNFDRDAITALKHKEDDCFDHVDGEEDEPMDSRSDHEWSGHHFNSGQKPAKRRRLIGEHSVRPSRDWTPAYTTTLEKLSNTGFVRASSHLQALENIPVNTIADARPSRPSAKKRTSDTEHKIVSGSTTRKPQQTSIANFFAPPGSKFAVSDYSVRTAQTSVSRQSSVSYQSSMRENPSPTVIPAPEPMILPTFANHRISNATLSLPTKRWNEDDKCVNPHKHYHHFSSSPQQHDSLIAEAENQGKLEASHKSTADQAKLPSTVIMSKPARIFHTTTLDSLNAKKTQFPARTLGLRRSVNGGWAERMKR